MVAPYPGMRRGRGRLLCGAEGDKGDEHGLCEQGCVFADFMMLLRLCPRAAASPGDLAPGYTQQRVRLAVVMAFSLKLAAALGGAVVGSELSDTVSLSVSGGGL